MCIEIMRQFQLIVLRSKSLSKFTVFAIETNLSFCNFGQLKNRLLGFVVLFFVTSDERGGEELDKIKLTMS